MAYQAEMQTEKGNMTITFYEKDAPLAVENFVNLSKNGFYDGLTFHRVLPGFVAQAGCPNGTGSGGPGYTIKCELTGENQFHEKGVLSMAHRGKDTGGSQFFLCFSREQTKHLDRVHTAFGKITGGIEVLDLIKQGDKINKIIVTEI